MAKIVRNSFKAERVFSDRQEARSVFHDTVKTLKDEMTDGENDSFYVINYYGIGGIGKSTLLEELKKSYKEGIGSYNFDYNSSDKMTIISSLANSLFNYNKSLLFYRLRMAIKRYEELTGIEVSHQSRDDAFFAENPFAKILDTLDSTPFFDLVPGSSVVGMINDVLQYADKLLIFGKDKARKLRFKTFLEELKKQNEKQITDSLHEYFYEDLRDFTENRKEPVVIFLDTYEKFVGQFVDVSNQHENETWLKRIVENVPGVLWIIAGRNKLNWEADYGVDSHLLGNLSESDSFSFLSHAGVPERLHEGIYKLTTGIPVFLDICVSTFEEYKNRDRVDELTVDDFGKDTNSLVEMYVKYLDDSQAVHLYYLSCLGRWTDRSALEISRNVLNMGGFNQNTYNKLVRQTIITKDSSKYMMNDVVRDILRNTEENGIRTTAYRTACAYYEDILENEIKDPDILFYAENLADNWFALKVLSPEEAPSVSVISLKLNNLYTLFMHDPRRIIAEKIYEECRTLLGEEDPETIDALQQIGISDWMLRHYQEELDTYKKVYELRLKTQGEDDPRTLKALSDVAAAHLNLGDLQTALELNNEAYGKRKDLFGEDDPDTLDSLHQIGIVYDRLDEFQKEKEIFQTLYEKRKGSSGPDDPKTLAALSNLAIAYNNLGDYKRSAELKKEVYERRLTVWGEDHPDVLFALSNLGIAYWRLGDYKRAADAFRTVYEKRKTLIGDDYPDTLDAMHNLGTVLLNMGNYSEAESILKSTYEKKAAVLGEDSPETLQTLNSLANLYSYMGDYERSLDVRRVIYENRRTALGEDHTVTLGAFENLGLAYMDVGDYRKAEEIIETTYQKRKLKLGESHPDTLTSLLNLGNSFFNQGNYSDADDAFRQVYEKRKAAYGEDYPGTLYALEHLRDTCFELHRFDEAIELSHKAYELNRTIYGENNPRTVAALREIGYSYLCEQKFEDAYKAYSTVYEKEKEIYGENNPLTLQSLSNVGTVYLNMKDYEKAAEIFRKAYLTLKETIGEDHPDTLSALDNLARTYFRMEDYETAREMYLQVYDRRKQVLGEDHPQTVSAKKAYTEAKQHLNTSGDGIISD